MQKLNIKIIAAIGCAAIVILAWAGVLTATLLFNVEGSIKVAMVVGAAILTEIMLWVGGAILGITAFQKIRGMMRFRKNQQA